MGISIKRNEKGLYNLKSTISDEQHHKEDWISEAEIKKILIERQFMSFVEKVVEIDMEFPNHYFINDRFEYIREKESFSGYIIKLIKNENYSQIYDDFNSVVDKLNLSIPKCQ